MHVSARDSRSEGNFRNFRNFFASICGESTLLSRLNPSVIAVDIGHNQPLFCRILTP